MRQFAVIGLGRFGSSLAETLSSLGYDVLGVDKDPARVQALANKVTHAVQADATDEETLKALGIRNFDVVVVAIGSNLQASLLITVLVKELGVPLVVSKATGDLHGKVLERIGADRVVFPERDMGFRLAHNLSSANIIDHIELSPDFSLVEIKAPQAMIGKTLRQLDLRARYGVNVIVIRRGDQIIVSPRADDRLQEGDVLVVIGEHEGLARLERRQMD